MTTWTGSRSMNRQAFHGPGGAEDAVVEAEQILDALDQVRLVVHDQQTMTLGHHELSGLNGRPPSVGLAPLAYAAAPTTARGKCGVRLAGLNDGSCRTRFSADRTELPCWQSQRYEIATASARA